MNDQSMMPIREFSIMTGIRRANLRFYDKEGLLTPEVRGENGYRYYTRRQTYQAFLISDLRALGVGLEEIKRYAGQRSPEKMLELFREQDAHIEKEIARLRSMQELMRLRADMALEAMGCRQNVVELEEKKREPIFLCPVYGRDCPEDQALIQSYDYAASHQVDTSFPIGVVVRQEALESDDWSAAQIYFKVRQNHNAWKPAGTYAVVHGQLVNDSSDHFYEQLQRFLREKGLRVGGDAYEEYLLDEMSIQEDDSFEIRVEVRVQN